MLDFSPRIHERGPDRIEIRSSYAPRVLFGLFAAFLLSGMIGGNLFSAGLLVVFGVAVAASLYTDRWIFDRTKGTAEYHLGLPYVHLRKIVPFEEIDHIEFSESPRGTWRRRSSWPGREVSPIGNGGEPAKRWRAQTVYTRVRLVMRNGKHHFFGVVSVEVVGTEGGTAGKIADFCRKPLSPMGYSET